MSEDNKKKRPKQMVNKELLLQLVRQSNAPIPSAEQMMRMVVESQVAVANQEKELAVLRAFVKAGGDDALCQAKTLLEQLEWWNEKFFVFVASMMNFMLHTPGLDIPFQLEVRDPRDILPYFTFTDDLDSVGIEKPKRITPKVSKLDPKELAGFPKLHREDGVKKKKDILN